MRFIASTLLTLAALSSATSILTKKQGGQCRVHLYQARRDGAPTYDINVQIYDGSGQQIADATDVFVDVPAGLELLIQPDGWESPLRFTPDMYLDGSIENCFCLLSPITFEYFFNGNVDRWEAPPEVGTSDRCSVGDWEDTVNRDMDCTFAC